MKNSTQPPLISITALLSTFFTISLTCTCGAHSQF